MDLYQGHNVTSLNLENDKWRETKNEVILTNFKTNFILFSDNVYFFLGINIWHIMGCKLRRLIIKT